MPKLDQHQNNAAIARHGWAALLKLLVAKGLITREESLAVVSAAHQGVDMFEQLGIANTADLSYRPQRDEME